MTNDERIDAYCRTRPCFACHALKVDPLTRCSHREYEVLLATLSHLDSDPALADRAAIDRTIDKLLCYLEPVPRKPTARELELASSRATPVAPRKMPARAKADPVPKKPPARARANPVPPKPARAKSARR